MTNGLLYSFKVIVDNGMMLLQLVFGMFVFVLISDNNMDMGEWRIRMCDMCDNFCDENVDCLWRQYIGVSMSITGKYIS